MDVVVPFRGGLAELAELRARLDRLRLRGDDSLVVVDNTPSRRSPAGSGRVQVIRAVDRATPGYARNRGVERGSADWLVFIDADTEPSEDLLDRYFDPPPGERTALLAGGIRDEAVPAGAPPAARYSYLRNAMGQENTFAFGRWSFPQTANAACRRAAFEQVGGFRETIRAAEDADLTFRLRAAGWEVERREHALVTHRSRQTVRGFLVQKLIHGAGGAWLNEEYPGTFPPRRRPGLTWWGIRHAAKGLVSAARARDRDTALWAVLEPLEHLAREFGRSLPNERRR